MDYIEVSAKNKDEAIIKASMQLETPSDELDIQIISEGSSGFLGFGSKPAIIRARKKDASELEAEVEAKIIKEKIEREAIVQPVKEVKKEVVKEVKAEVKEEPVIKKEEVKPPVEEIMERPLRVPVKTLERPHQRKQQPKEITPKAPVKEMSKPVKKESRPVEVITDPAEIEEIKKSASDFLNGVFRTMDLQVEIKSEYNTQDGCLEIDFAGDDMGILIGKRGQTLDSLQYLTSLVVNKEKSSYVRVKLDTEDYRNRRKVTLENLAKGIAYKVRKTRKPVVLEPMNPYERRIIHSVLQGNRYVETFSEGEEPYRHVVIKLKSRK